MSIKTPVVAKHSENGLSSIYRTDNELLCADLTREEAAEIAAKLNLWPKLVTALSQMTETTVSDDRYVEITKLLAECERIEEGEK